VNEKILTDEESVALDATFAEFEPEPTGIMSAAALDAEENAVSHEQASEEPSMADPAWSDFVLRQFQEDELHADGSPLVHGLRRVARQLLGPIINSQAHVCQSPTFHPNFDKASMLTPAVVEYTVTFLWTRPEDLPEHGAAHAVTFTDVADVYFGNTDPDFARHATATAATKAEARALRKALGLRAVAAEEKTSVPLEQASVTGLINSDQIRFIDVLCRRNNISVMALVNAGKKKYATVEDVPFGIAQKMVQFLSDLQNDQSKIRAEYRGYDAAWRDEK
jgi:hypothetical protein